MLLGIYFSRYENFEFAGFLFDRSIKWFIARFFSYAIIVGAGLVIVRFVTIK